MMASIAYLNGQFMPASEVQISPLDRGFLFGDGVYEVIPVYSGHPFQVEKHIERLNQSLQNIRMLPPLSMSEWKALFTTLIEKNGSGDQSLYCQVTRGVDTHRDHQFPKQVSPTLFVISYPKPRLSKEVQSKGIKATAVTDIRWKYCHIKTTSRLAYVLMLQEAKEAGFDEAIIVNNGFALEGATSNLFIVRHGVIITPPKSHQILSGTTRDCLLTLAEKNRIPYREAKITERELLKADEIWVTGSVRRIQPVIEFNGVTVGQGKAGPVWEKIWDLYEEDINRVSLPISH